MLKFIDPPFQRELSPPVPSQPGLPFSQGSSSSILPYLALILVCSLTPTSFSPHLCYLYISRIPGSPRISPLLVLLPYFTTHSLHVHPPQGPNPAPASSQWYSLHLHTVLLSSDPSAPFPACLAPPIPSLATPRPSRRE